MCSFVGPHGKDLCYYFFKKDALLVTVDQVRDAHSPLLQFGGVVLPFSDMP
jgi:hypothetical protein